MRQLARLFHTVRSLRPVQFWGRLWGCAYRPLPDLRPAPPARERLYSWQSCARAASMTSPSTFCFLGIEHTLDSARDWNRDDWPKLWLYNLHYFDDLVAADASERNAAHHALIERWVVDNVPVRGIGWKPYPTSLRIVNWVKWALSGHVLDEQIHTSLAIQVRWLRKNLEIHLQGNHLWANAKALVFAGLYFKALEAGKWLQKGRALIDRELKEQVLADGGHFERSPMYHCIILEDVLDLVQLAGIFPDGISDVEVSRWRNTATRMLHWLRVMSHPDGGIAFFNDAAFGIAPNYDALCAYARTLGVSVPERDLQAIEALSESGYIRMMMGSAVLVADVGKIGPDYMPGHAHADTLSFELSLHGRRVLANSGTSTYEVNAERLRQRGTAAHNTVQIDGQNSSEVWSSFRVARRARPLDVSWGQDGDTLWVRAGQDGYVRLGRVGRVDRIWRMHGYGIKVEDRIEGSPQTAVSRFRAHPAFAFEKLEKDHGALYGQDDELCWRAHDSGDIRIADSTWHPRFGASEPCQVLELNLKAGKLVTEFRWANYSWTCCKKGS